MNLLRADSIAKQFGASPILADIDLAVDAGEIVCLYGPSGCGKTTLMRILGGLDPANAGRVTLDGERVLGPSARIGLVAQQGLQFDWLTVSRNITFGMRYVAPRGGVARMFGKVPRRARLEVARRMAALVGLDYADLDKYPAEISGGMKQRMSLARALVPRPRLILLDEPFSALDFDARHDLQDLILNLRDQTGTSFVCVSHDPEEVIYLADKILVLGGSPARVTTCLQPRFFQSRNRALKYTAQFQAQKRELRATLGH